MSFSFSYFIGENFENNLVSAIDFSDYISGGSAGEGIDELMDSLGGGVGTCKLSKDGKKCQEYFLSECDDKCTENCVRKARKDLDNGDECKLGVCFDEERGTCAYNTGKWECEDGEWYAEDDARGIEKCEKHCCVLRDQALFVNEKTCETTAESLGLELGKDDAYFDSSIIAEPACIDAVYFVEKGACVTALNDGSDKNYCKLTTSTECNNLGGRFSDSYLCSHPDLNTICEKQNTTGCVEGRDEVFWFDSCGNRENIYDYDRDISWNDGMVLDKKDSCELKKDLSNQDTCGNCYRFLGSICGNATEKDEEKKDSPTEIVCKDMSCVDEKGKKREHGETWCEYQSAIGVSTEIPFLGTAAYYRGFHIPGLHSMAAPGSEQYRKSCIDGEIKAELCAGYRNGICVESKTKDDDGKEFSTASCRPNRWAECLNYNTQNDPNNILSQILPGVSQLAQFIPAAGKILQLPAEAEKVKVGLSMLQCEKDPDCFVNNVAIDDFKFPICEPKYPAGFYEKDNGGEDERICSFASQTCSSVWVYEATAFTFSTTAHWECKANCGCVTDVEDPKDAQPSKEFVTQMNDICVSLGDCGMKTNYNGQAGIGGYALKRADYEGLPKEGGAKNKQIASGSPAMPYDDSKPIAGKYIKPETITEDALGSGESSVGANAPKFEAYDATAGLLTASLATGGSALAVAGMAHAGWLGTAASSVPTATSSSWAAAQAGMPGTYAIPLSEWGGPLVIEPTTATTVPAMYQSSTGVLSMTAPAEGGELVAVGLEVGPEVGGIPASVEHVPVSASLYAEQSAGQGSVELVGGSQMSTAAAAFQAAAIGAAIGVFVTSLLVGISGIGAGIGQGGVIAYMGVAAASGAMIASLPMISPALYTMSANLFGLQLGGMIGPIGIAVAVILIADIIANWIAGVGEIRTVEVTFECKEWQPPMGGANCEKCGKKGFPCNKYACETLGQTCQWMAESEGPDGGVCISIGANDVSGPRITGPMEDVKTEGFEYAGITEDGFKIENEDGKCATQFDGILFGFETDEYAKCKISGKADAKFEEMAPFGRDSWSKNHTYEFSAYELTMLGIGDLEPEKETDVNLYIKCQDGAGNVREDNYNVGLCVIPLDLTAPTISNSEPNEIWTSYNAETEEIERYTLEPAECRWSYDDEEYSEMGNQMECNTEEATPLGYKCAYEISLNNEDTIYVRCLDHPEWEGTEREDNRNANQESSVIVIKESESPLVIDSIKPDNEIITWGAAIVPINFAAETSGGYDGNAQCYLRVDGGVRIAFDKTGGKLHEQLFTSLIEGEHVVEVDCVDSVGNEAMKEAKFTVKRDLTYAEVTRIYEESGSLIIVTSESGECAFVNENACNFDFGKGKVMSVGGNKRQEHKTGFDGMKTYYIRCKDDYGNMKGGCSAIVKQGFI